MNLRYIRIQKHTFESLLMKYNYKRMRAFLSSQKEALQKQKFEHIIAVGRGAMIVAVHLSHMLDVPISVIPWSRKGGGIIPNDVYDVIERGEKILFVDEIVDTGITMHMILRKIELAFENGTMHYTSKRTFKPQMFCLVYIKNNLFTPTYYDKNFDTKNEFVDFFWEK